MQDAQALCAVPSSLQVRCTYTYVRVYIRIYAHICKRCRSVCWCCYSFYYSGSISYLVQKTHKVINSHVYITHTHTVLLLILLLMIDLIPGTKVQTLLSSLVQKLLIGYATPKTRKKINKYFR